MYCPPPELRSVTAVQVDHRVNALAYVLNEDERVGRFNLEMTTQMVQHGVPDSQTPTKRNVLCQALRLFMSMPTMRTS